MTTRFLDPKVLARIDRLDLLARTVVDGFVAGLHQSPHLGVSVDFAEHRAYMPGDDIRRIDWRVYGRTDRLYVKQFEAETNANISILIDISASMDYASQGISKLDYARYLAASLAYFSFHQRDRVGLVTFDQDVVTQVPPTGRRLDTILHSIDRIAPGGRGQLDLPLRRIAESIRRRSILVLISDLYEPPQEVLTAINRLRRRGNDLIVFHLLDPTEIEFTFDEATQFEDLETGERIPVVPARVRAGYRGLMQEHVAELTQRMGQNRIDYYLIETSKPLDHALFHYLSRRHRMSRVR
ncbi:MAG: DUF58 domain-containing protein [Gemmatimonadales bacterium]|nr:MAG: DUF58 domain-containing protein [Gemmatimonadales bacterium]